MMRGEQFVVFRIGREKYAVSISQAKEIIIFKAPTKISSRIEGMLGIINLRGKILSIIDLGKNIGIQCNKRIEERKIIVIEDRNGDFGVLVDDVEDIIKLPNENIYNFTRNVCKNNDYIIGIAKQNESLLVMVDLNLFLGKCLNEIYD
jgi:purine-binding chemotaxis protein CheW